VDSDAGLLRIYFNGSGTVRTLFNQNVWFPYQFTLANRVLPRRKFVPWRVNGVTNYTFTQGALAGVNNRAGLPLEQERILGYGISQDSTGQWNLDVTKPLHGPANNFSMLGSAIRANLSRKIGYQVQLNVSNIGDKTHLVPLTLQPDGGPGSYRIQQGMTWQIRNTITF